MNRKGFTLVELLAVIVILALLMLVAGTSITRVVKKARIELYNSQIEIIEVAAQTWMEGNFDKLPDDGECKYLTLYDLKNTGILDSSVLDPRTSKEINDNLNIKITAKLTEYDNLNFKYEVDSNDISSCTPVYYKPCKLIADTDNSNSITVGDKYQCKVKDDMEDDFEDGYYFYVLSYNDKDGKLTDDITKAKTINLIMDRNICDDGTVATSSNKCLLAWLSQTDYITAKGENWGESGDNSYGPITAMTYLYNATKNWTNISALNYEYKDIEWQESLGIEISGGYNSFTSKDGVGKINGVKFTGEEPLRVRMPIYAYDDEVEYGEVSHKKNDGSNSYLYENMSGSGIAGIMGYWTLSSNAANSSNACRVLGDGVVNNSPIYYSGSIGVRPVITVFEYQLVK